MWKSILGASIYFYFGVFKFDWVNHFIFITDHKMWSKKKYLIEKYIHDESKKLHDLPCVPEDGVVV